MKIAISSGHRETAVLAIADEVPLFDGRPFYFRLHKSLNLHCLDEEELRNRLKAMLNDLREALPEPLRQPGATRDDRLVLSLPGVSSLADLERGKGCVQESWWSVGSPENYLVVDDTYTGLLGGARSTQGICAFAGTGASVYLGDPHGDHQAFIPDKSVKLDGFGPMIGDHGSGFRLAIATLERMGRDLDEDGWTANSPLYEKLLKGLGADWDAIKDRGLQNGFDDLMANRGPDWRFKIAELAQVITEAAKAGDKYAESQVTDAAHAIGRTIRIGLHLFDDLDEAPIYCQGGMFRHSEIYRRKVREFLNWPEDKIQMARYKPIVGALILAAAPGWVVAKGDSTQADVLRLIDGVPMGDPAREKLFNITT